MNKQIIECLINIILDDIEYGEQCVKDAAIGLNHNLDEEEFRVYYNILNNPPPYDRFVKLLRDICSNEDKLKATVPYFKEYTEERITEDNLFDIVYEILK